LRQAGERILGELENLKVKERMNMKKVAFSSALAAIFFLATFNALSQEVPAPLFQEKDFWQFKAVEQSVGGISRSNSFDGIYEVLYLQGNFKTFQMTNNGREPADRSARGPLLALVGRSPVIKDLQFPFSVGQKWDYKYESTAIGSKRPFLRTVEISVMGVEQVTTPAGSFNAFKLEKEETVKLGERPWVGTFYYSPDTKSVVKSSFDSTQTGAGTKREIELIKFGSAH
jgi:hypothetical protein